MTSLPKADGTTRPIGIASVRDRVVQYALLSVLEPTLDPGLHPRSFAFRPGRSAHQAVELAREEIASGMTWVVKADIRKCFERVDCERLLGRLSTVIGDRSLLRLIAAILRTHSLGDDGSRITFDLGLARGSPLSPLLCNFHLDPVDRRLESAGVRFLRYADDLALFAPSEAAAEQARLVLEQTLHDRLRMELNPEKTSVTSIREGCAFLGFVIGDPWLRIQDNRLDRALEVCRGIVEALGDPTATERRRHEAFSRYNGFVNGFRGYFAQIHSTNVEGQLSGLDRRIADMAERLVPAGRRDDDRWVGRLRFGRQTPLASRGVLTSVGLYESATSHSVPEAAAPKPSPPARRPPQDAVVETDGRLTVLRSYVHLDLDGSDLAVRRSKVDLFRKPIADLKVVTVQGRKVSLAVDLVARLAESGVTVVMSPGVGPPAAIVEPARARDGRLRIRQARRATDPDLRSCALSMLAAKVANQAAVLRYFGKYQRKQGRPLADLLESTALSLRGVAETILGLDVEQERLPAVAMGHEGRAAALYWRAFAGLIGPAHGFPGRRTRGAEDPVNQCLNYAYGLLYGEVWRAVVQAGLDPHGGILPGSVRDGGSLVFDLIEELRAPICDRLVAALLNRGLSVGRRADGRLDHRTTRLLVEAFHRTWRRPLRRGTVETLPAQLLSEQCRSFAALIRDGEAYRPFRMRW